MRCRRLQPERTAQRGQILLELILGLAAIALVLGGAITVLLSHGRIAAAQARDARVRLLLEGEMEILRGLPAIEIRACTAAPFAPSLGVPPALKTARFLKSVTLEQNGAVARVTLEAHFAASAKRAAPIVIQGTVYRER